MFAGIVVERLVKNRVLSGSIYLKSRRHGSTRRESRGSYAVEYELRVDDVPWDTEQQAAISPTRGIDMGVEKPLDPVKRFALQIAPVIFVDKARCRDRRSCGAASQFGLSLLRQ